MRKLLSAAIASACLASGAFLAHSATAQPYGYYSPPPYYDAYRDRYYRPYVPYTPYAPGYAYGYDGSATALGLGLSALGALLGSDLGGVPVDRYGPDPNGMIALDGHRIKCKIRDRW